MRITADKKRATRARILAVATEMLGGRPLGDVTTRDVAERTGIAHGTLFNYFKSKEALALCLCGEQLERAAARADALSKRAGSLEEDLFAHAAETMTHLAPYRGWAGELFAATFRPGLDGLPATARGDARADGPDAEGKAVRAAGPAGPAGPAGGPADPCALKARVLEGVRSRIVRWHGPAAAGDATLHLYWSLYLGVLAWWATDASPHQEETLAVLDQALSMFVASLPPPYSTVP